MSRRRRVLVLLAGVAVACGAGPLGVHGAAADPASAAAGGLVPVAARVRLDARAGAVGQSPAVPIDILSASCPSKGNCVAAGWATRLLVETSFVISERNGRWGRAQRLAPRIMQINVRQIACPAAGYCVAAGNAGSQAFVIDEVHGVWHGMRLVALDLGKRHGAKIMSVSCGSPGNCVAGGAYAPPSSTPGNEVTAAFLITERNFRWGRAFPVPGLPASRFMSSVLSVSCASAGSCAAGGQLNQGYEDPANEAFMIIERNGRWGRAFQVAGNLGGSSPAVDSVSCVAAGDCVAGGISGVGGVSQGQAFLVTERDGRRGQAVAVTGVSDARDITVSCRSLGSCSAGGSAGNDFLAVQAFLVDETGGRWGSAMPVPGLSALGTGHDSAITLSCAWPGNCAAGGFYNSDLPFVMSETNGHWGTALPVQGQGTGFNIVTPVSCAPARSPASYCVTGGIGFLISDVNGHWGQPVPALTP